MRISIFKPVHSAKILAGIFLGLVAAQAQDTPTGQYFADFEGAIGPEWSATTTSVTPVGARRFLGEFGNESVTLTLTNLPPHSTLSVEFDVYILRSWDGNGNFCCGPDRWQFGVDGGPTLIDTTFGYTNLYGIQQSYPGDYPAINQPLAGAKEVYTLGYTFSGSQGTVLASAVYHPNLALPHADPNLTLRFTGLTSEDITNESWGLDNVRVAWSGPAAAPIITTQPADQTVATTYPVTFSASVVGSGVMSYQWLRNGTNVPDATNVSFVISNVTYASAGTYALVAANSLGSAVSSNAVLKVVSPYSVTTLAGLSGSVGSANGPGSTARFNAPSGVGVDGAGNIYIGERDNFTIRKITPAGNVTTLAGGLGVSGNADGTGTAARFNHPVGVAADSAGNVYVVDRDNYTIRKITPAGVVTTLAGSAGQSGSVDGIGAAARFSDGRGIAVDAEGNLYVADRGNNTIRKITAAGLVTTLAGKAGNSANADGLGSAARFNQPLGVAVDGAGNVYVGDFSNHTIRKITSAGLVSTFAGRAGVSGRADGIGGAARFNGPFGVAVDKQYNVYVTDANNRTLRKITPEGMVTTLAGQVGVIATTDGLGSAARFGGNWGLAVDGAGTIYISDQSYSIIRTAVDTTPVPPGFGPMRLLTVAGGPSQLDLGLQVPATAAAQLESSTDLKAWSFVLSLSGGTSTYRVNVEGDRKYFRLVRTPAP